MLAAASLTSAARAAHRTWPTTAAAAATTHRHARACLANCFIDLTGWFNNPAFAANKKNTAMRVLRLCRVGAPVGLRQQGDRVNDSQPQALTRSPCWRRPTG